MNESLANRALLLGDDIGVFLAVARSLGRRGIEVHVAPADLEASGLKSRFVGAVHSLPPYHRDPEAWLAALRALIDAHDYRLIMPCDDSRLLILRCHATQIGRDLLAIANDEALEAFTDKTATRALAASLGVPVAFGRTICDRDRAPALVAELGLPLVLKPAASYAVGDHRDKTPAQIVRSPAEVEQALEDAVGRTWLAESYFPGVGKGISVLAQDGKILLAWQHRRLRVGRETGGSTVRFGEKLDARLFADVQGLTRATGLTGIAMFEFRVNRSSGGYVLLEVNPRFWGSLPLAVAGGADFPAMLWDVLTGRAIEAPPAPIRLLTKRSMSGEFERLTLSFEEAPRRMAKFRRALAIAGFMTTLVLRSRFDSWAEDDPRPYRAERGQLWNRLFAAARRAGFGAG